MPFSGLACPLDGYPLIHSAQQWCCEAGHSFDIARQGYVHLLPVQKKRTKNPGDSREMVAARLRFLSAEFYTPIADAVNRAVLTGLAPSESISCLDAGCGEGYYLRKVAESVSDYRDLSILGVDISKSAVLAAAKQKLPCQWVVATNANLPVLPESVDRILCLFGFPVYREFARVLSTGGRIIQADAGYDHLRELREIIYPELKPPGTSREVVPEGFELINTDTVRYEIDLPGKGEISDLLAMTPHLYRASAEGRAKAALLDTLRVTINVDIRCYQKQKA
jgi:23S rRNA (guanine745-N1)-methyltransferase